MHLPKIETKEWKQCAFAGNTLECRWGHSACLVGNQVLLYGGRDDTKYHNSVKTIDLSKFLEFHPANTNLVLAQELIEIDQEEVERQITRRQYLEEKKTREAIGNLQSNLEELRHVVTRIGTYGKQQHNKLDTGPNNDNDPHATTSS